MNEQLHHRTRSSMPRIGGAIFATLLAIGFFAACGATRPSQTPASMPPPSRPLLAETKPLDLTVRVRAERDGRKWGVVTGDTLRTSDFFELFVHLNQPAYLYVIQVLPDGTPSTLFPDKGHHLLAAEREHRIPDVADESFQVDSHDEEENIYVLMSRAPLAQASALITASDHAPSAAGNKRRDSPPKDSSRRAPEAANPGAAIPRRPDRLLSITTRRVIRVKRQDGTPAVVDTTDQRKDSTLVVKLHFKHA